MRIIVLALLMSGIVVNVSPAHAAEPAPGFADRLVMACMHVGVTNVALSEDGYISRYNHTGTSSKNDMETCLVSAYQTTLSNLFPTYESGHTEATHAKILKNGNILLY